MKENNFKNNMFIFITESTCHASETDKLILQYNIYFKKLAPGFTYLFQFYFSGFCFIQLVFIISFLLTLSFVLFSPILLDVTYVPDTSQFFFSLSS